MELKLETPSQVAAVDIEQLVPWGLTEDQYAELGLRCLAQSGMSQTRLDRLRAELFPATGHFGDLAQVGLIVNRIED